MLDEPKQVLVVEDNIALGAVVRFNLEQAGFQVALARNGREGWGLIQKRDFDLVVTDYQMPEMSGAELCEQMRQHPQYAQIPVLLLTAKGLELDLPQLREELGIFDVFLKPFSPY